MSKREPLIPSHGGYRQLKSFQVAQLVYDVTVRFCDRYVERRSRTHDQMVQAARSGVQNIAEGSQASGTSRKMEIKLTNVARASLVELRLDYEDFLRQRGREPWRSDDPRRAELIELRPRSADEVARWVKEVDDRRSRPGQSGQSGHSGHSGHSGQSGPRQPSNPDRPRAQRGAVGRVGSAGSRPSTVSTVSTLSTRPVEPYAETAANAVLVLIAVACGLLRRQLAAQAAAFECEGGFSERMHRIRGARRG